MHKLYRITAIPQFCNAEGNPFGEPAGNTVSWKGFYSDKRIREVKYRFELERGKDAHPYLNLDITPINPYQVAVNLAQYFLSKGEYETKDENVIQERLEEFSDMQQNARKYLMEFLELHTDAMAPEPFDNTRQSVYNPDLEIDSDFIEELLEKFDSLIRNHYEPYTPLGRYIDESEEEIESYNKVYLENGMLVTRDYIVNKEDVTLREGADGKLRNYVFFTFNDYLSEYSDCIWEADIDSFLSEYTDEVRWRKSLGYTIEEPSQFMRRWFANYTKMELSDFPQEWQDAINDTHAIAAA